MPDSLIEENGVEIGTGSGGAPIDHAKEFYFIATPIEPTGTELGVDGP